MVDPLPQHARILLIRLSALGDVLFALETLASLKAERPDLRVDFLVEDRFADILKGHPQVERLLIFPRRSKRRIPGALRTLRQVRYDAVLDLHCNLKSSLWTWFARAGRKLGFAAPIAREGAHHLYRERIQLPHPVPHRAQWGLHLLRALGLRGDPAAALLPPLTSPTHFWEGTPHPRIVMHPGTSAFAAFKRWPLPHHGELARRLLADGCTVAISIGPGEEALGEQIQKLARGVRILDGKALGLLGSAAIYREADLLVASDTGPLHVAAAAGTPVIALFGPKDPRLYGPRGDPTILFADVPCRPCRRRRCVSPQCVLGIEVDRVESAIKQRLASIHEP